MQAQPTYRRRVRQTATVQRGVHFDRVALATFAIVATFAIPATFSTPAVFIVAAALAIGATLALTALPLSGAKR